MASSEDNGLLVKRILMIEGPGWPFLDFTEPKSVSADEHSSRFTILDKPVYLYPNASNIECIDSEDAAVRTATSVWDGSIILAKALEYHGHRFENPSRIKPGSFLFELADKRVIELGSGRGLVGISAAILRASVTLTDVDSVIPQLETSLTLNQSSFMTGNVTTLAVDWIQKTQWPENSHFDVIVGADIIWIPELVEPLVLTITDVLSLNPKSYMLLSHQTRASRTDDLFFSKLSYCGLYYKNLGQEYCDPRYQNDKVNLYVIYGDEMMSLISNAGLSPTPQG